MTKSKSYDLNKAFESFFRNPPAVDFPTTYSRSSNKIEIAVPGFSSKDVQVTAYNNVLSLSGKNSKNEVFNYTYTYKQVINSKGTKATCRNGILSVKLAFLADTYKGQEIPVGT